jgi:2-phosphosulfolactate phosphatase
MTELEQPGFDPRMEWSAEGAVLLARVCVVVVVDVLRFTTAVEVAVARGAVVVPRPWAAGRGPAAGGGVPAGPASGSHPGPGPSSLSPASLLGVAAGTRVELASPNGAMVALAAAEAGAVVLAGCLRNASAVGAAARVIGGPVGVVAAGERRAGGALRPAVEDLVGAGAVLHAAGSVRHRAGSVRHRAGGRPSPKARAAMAAFRDAAGDLPGLLAGCVSGRELAERGLAADLRLAAEHDVSQVVPRLDGGAFAQLSWPG